MSEQSVEQLFDEFARAYVHGERPDVRAALERAGPDRDDLAALIDGFLQAVAARAPSEEEIVLMQARLEDDPPLLVLRRRRKASRAAVVDALVSLLGVDSRKREKVYDYFHELEVGRLDPKPVSSRVWDALDEVLRANVRALAGLRPPPAFEGMVVFERAAADYQAKLDVQAPAASEPVGRRSRRRAAAPAPDDVDRLFTGGA